MNPESFRRSSGRLSARENLTFTPREASKEQQDCKTTRFRQKIDFEKAYTSFLDTDTREYDTNTFERWRRRGRALMSSTWTQITIVGVILTNTILIGMETDNPDLFHWNQAQAACLYFFTAELAMRMALTSVCDFFDREGDMFYWNLLNMSATCAGYTNMLVTPRLDHSISSLISTTLECLQLFRLLRVFRLLRFCKGLYQMAYGVMLAAVAVFWVTLFMFFALFVCAIVLVRCLGDRNMGLHDDISDADINAGSTVFVGDFSNISEAMFTLFQLVVQPNLTGYHDIMQESPIFAVFLVTFVIFGSFGTIALLTGVTSEAMFAKNIIRSEAVRQGHEVMLWNVSKAVGQLFDKVEHDQDEEASHVQLMRILPEIADVFDDYGLSRPQNELKQMLKYMDSDASGKVSKAEFCRGVLQMAEEDTRPMLLMELHSDTTAYIKNRVDNSEFKLDRLLLDQQRPFKILGETINTLLARRTSQKAEIGRWRGRRSKEDIRADWLSQDQDEAPGSQMRQQPEHSQRQQLQLGPRSGPGGASSGSVSSVQVVCDSGGSGSHKSAMGSSSVVAAAPPQQHGAGSAEARKRLPKLLSDVRGLRLLLDSLTTRKDDYFAAAEASLNGDVHHDHTMHRTLHEKLVTLGARVGECEFAVTEATGFSHRLAQKVTELRRPLAIFQCR